MKERLAAAAAAVSALAQRRPALAAIVLGLVGACAYPPLHLWPLGLAALAGFVWLIHSATSWRSALGLGWCFGWAHLTLANNSIATAFTHQAKMPEALGWASPPGSSTPTTRPGPRATGSPACGCAGRRSTPTAPTR